jgi:hypothetical protein
MVMVDLMPVFLAIPVAPGVPVVRLKAAPEQELAEMAVLFTAVLD